MRGGYDMSNLVETIGKLLYGVSKQRHSLENEIARKKDVLRGFIAEGQRLTVKQFLNLYNARIYNMNNKQNDIKYMKMFEFEGVYIIYNFSKDKYYIGKASKVLRKVERQFKGSEKQELYAEIKNKDIIYVNVVKLQLSEYDNISQLEKSAREQCKMTGSSYVFI